MTRYRVYLSTTAHAGVTVEADDEQAAIEAAICADMPTICAQCSGWGSSHNLEIGDEWDVPDESYVYEDESEEGDS